MIGTVEIRLDGFKYGKTHMRICIGFFGLNRSLRWTGESIKKNVIEPVLKLSSDVTIIGHFNVPDQIHNLRAGEKAISYKIRDLEKIKFDYLALEKQSSGNIEKYIKALQNAEYLGEKANSLQMITNHLNQLYSLEQLHGLIKSRKLEDVDVFVFLRPDLDYINSVDFPPIFESIINGHADLVTPDWQMWGGLNDRAAICSKNGAKAYLTRIQFILDFYDATRYIHAEKLLKYCADQLNLRVSYFDLQGVRVRASGYTSLESFSLPLWRIINYKLRNLISKTGFFS